MFGFHFLLSAAGVVWLYWLWTRRRYYALIFKIPGPLGYPLLGILPFLLRKEEILKRLNQYRAKYGKCMLSWWLICPIVAVSDPVLVQDVLTSPSCNDKPFLYKVADDAIGKSILSINDPVWSSHRKLINPAFNRSAVQSFIPLINQEVNGLQQTFAIWAASGDPVNIISRLRKFTVMLTIRTTMGTSVAHSGQETAEKVVESFLLILDMIIQMVLLPYLLVPFVRKLLGVAKPYEEAKSNMRQFTRSIIERKLAAAAESDSNSTAKLQTFLDLAIHLGRQGYFSQHEMESETNSLIIEGSQALANTITYALVLLAMFPQYQDKLFEELLSIFPDGGEFDVTDSNIHDMVYLDMVLNESMRVLPPVPALFRTNFKDFSLSNGVVVPAGVQIMVDIFNIHRCKDIWGAGAHTFNPDHFLPTNRQETHPYAFLPFAMGVRKCIAYRYAAVACKITLAKLVRNFKFTTDFKFEDLELVQEITLKLKHMPLLQVDKRRT